MNRVNLLMELSAELQRCRHEGLTMDGLWRVAEKAELTKYLCPKCYNTLMYSYPSKHWVCEACVLEEEDV